MSIKFHPSGVGTLMTNARGRKTVESITDLSETTKSALLNIWIEETYGRRKQVRSKYFEKGKSVEEDSITLYSLVTKKFLKKNIDTLQNDWFIGTPDLYIGGEIWDAEIIPDIKSSWDLFTYHSAIMDFKKAGVDFGYLCQLNCYADMTGAKELRLVYCLVSAPEDIILTELNRLAWDMKVIDRENDHEYLKAAKELEESMLYDDIDRNKRVFEIIIPVDYELIAEIKHRVKFWREYIDHIDKTIYVK